MCLNMLGRTKNLPGANPWSVTENAFGMGPGPGCMETLHPNIRAVWLLQALIGAGVIGGLSYAIHVLVVQLGLVVVVGVVVIAAVIGGVHAILRYRAWGFAVEDDALYLDRGVLTKVQTSIPFVRVQHVDTQRGPVARLLGIASVVVYTAGSRSADVAIPGLSPKRAKKLREQLRDLAIESETEDAV